MPRRPKWATSSPASRCSTGRPTDGNGSASETGLRTSAPCPTESTAVLETTVGLPSAASPMTSGGRWRRRPVRLGWLDDPRFVDFDRRLAHQDELDALVESWTREHDSYDVMDALQRGDVPAGVCQNAQDRCERDPHRTPQLAHGARRHPSRALARSRAPHKVVRHASTCRRPAPSRCTSLWGRQPRGSSPSCLACPTMRWTPSRKMGSCEPNPLDDAAAVMPAERVVDLVLEIDQLDSRSAASPARAPATDAMSVG